MPRGKRRGGSKARTKSPLKELEKEIEREEAEKAKGASLDDPGNTDAEQGDVAGEETLSLPVEGHAGFDLSQDPGNWPVDTPAGTEEEPGTTEGGGV